MEITVPILTSLSLKLSDHAALGIEYPTAAIQKGFILFQDGKELAEEGIGFGVPILMHGLQTVFPGAIELIAQKTGPIYEVTVRFTLNLEEKIVRPGSGSVGLQYLYALKSSLAAMLRAFPPSRGLLTAASNLSRRIFGWATTFEAAAFSAVVDISYAIDTFSGTLSITVDTTKLPPDNNTEVIVMNEQGARHFDRYRDASGLLLHGKEIGCWDVVTAEWASFESQSHRLAFTLPQISGVKLFRGRELIGSRLAWSGFGYSFPSTRGRISYVIKIERLE